MESIVANILKAHHADLLRKIADRYDIGIDDLRAKYLRPTFYLPDVNTSANAVVEYKELKTKRVKNTTNGENVSRSSEKNPK